MMIRAWATDWCIRNSMIKSNKLIDVINFDIAMNVSNTIYMVDRLCHWIGIGF